MEPSSQRSRSQEHAETLARDRETLSRRVSSVTPPPLSVDQDHNRSLAVRTLSDVLTSLRILRSRVTASRIGLGLGLAAMSQPVTVEPAAHSYLSTNMEDLPGRSILESGDEYTLPIIPFRGVVLFPGETLPLRLKNSRYISVIEQLLANPSANGNSSAMGPGSVHVGVVSLRTYASDGDMWHPYHVGTTAEIRSRQYLPNGELALKAKGRHRFRILSMNPDHSSTGVVWARVSVLSDEYQLRRRFKRPMEAITNPYPAWAYEMSDPHTLMRRAVSVLPSITGWHFQHPNESDQQEHTSSMPSDPVHFSYWLAANLPLPDDARQELLEVDSVSLRLRMCIGHLTQAANVDLCCGTCGEVLAKRGDIFTVPGAEGVVGAYVNPQGYVHQTVTLARVLNRRRLIVEGWPTTQDTWFPGYAWQITYCASCYCHIGWIFTSVTSSHPQEFWGMRRGVLKEELHINTNTHSRVSSQTHLHSSGDGDSEVEMSADASDIQSPALVEQATTPIHAVESDGESDQVQEDQGAGVSDQEFTALLGILRRAQQVRQVPVMEDEDEGYETADEL